MKRTVLWPLLATAVLAAEPQSMVIPFAGYLGYGSQSAKESGLMGGLYGVVSRDGQSLELQYAYTDIAYRDGVDDLIQNDFTAIYAKQLDRGMLLRAGVHYIDSDDAYTDGGTTLLLGLHRSAWGDYDAGAELYYTNYPNFDSPLSVWQVTPSVTKSLAEDWSLKAAYTFITFRSSKITETVLNMGSMMSSMGRSPHTIVTYEEYSDTYHSAEVALTHRHGLVNTTATLWLGKQAFAVRDGGFSVFNLAEIHKGGVSLTSRYAYSERSSLSAALFYERFTDTQTGDDTGVTGVWVSYGYRF
ncbi:hypothetical protein [Hydrogenimonas sp.]